MNNFINQSSSVICWRMIKQCFLLRGNLYKDNWSEFHLSASRNIRLVNRNITKARRKSESSIEVFPKPSIFCRSCRSYWLNTDLRYKCLEFCKRRSRVVQNSRDIIDPPHTPFTHSPHLQPVQSWSLSIWWNGSKLNRRFGSLLFRRKCTKINRRLQIHLTWDDLIIFFITIFLNCTSLTISCQGILPS